MINIGIYIYTYIYRYIDIYTEFFSELFENKLHFLLEFTPRHFNVFLLNNSYTLYIIILIY